MMYTVMIPDIKYFSLQGNDGNHLYRIEGQKGLVNQSGFDAYKNELGSYGRLKGINPSEEQRDRAMQSLRNSFETEAEQRYGDDIDRAILEADKRLKNYMPVEQASVVTQAATPKLNKSRMAGTSSFEDKLNAVLTPYEDQIRTNDNTD